MSGTKQNMLRSVIFSLLQVAMVMSKGAVAVVLDVSEFRAAVKLVTNNNI